MTRFTLKTLLGIVAIVLVGSWVNAGLRPTEDHAQTAPSTVSDPAPVVAEPTRVDRPFSFVDQSGEPVAVVEPTPVKEVAGELASGGTLNAGDTLIGRWCWRDVPGHPEHNVIISLKRNDTGAVELQHFYRGKLEEPVVIDEVSSGTFLHGNRDVGDYMRIVSSGQLHLLDNMGLIAAASRLGDVATAGECSH